MRACSPPGTASPSTERGRLASYPSSPSLVSSPLFADKTVRVDGVTHRSIGTFRQHVIYTSGEQGRELQFAASMPSIVQSTVTAIRAHATTVGHMYSCDQLAPKGHVLLAVIKPHVSHMYVLFVYKVKLKGSTMQK